MSSSFLPNLLLFINMLRRVGITVSIEQSMEAALIGALAPGTHLWEEVIYRPDKTRYNLKKKPIHVMGSARYEYYACRLCSYKYYLSGYLSGFK